MSNNLYKVEKDLRSIAKRYKSIKYSIGLAILFLMLGTGAFSEEVNNVQAGEVPTREENKKSLAGLRLELIQLMEQGDQVVKSPWASWQFGANYDAAVMCSGLCGHGLGATPSAIVNMTAINEKYGMSRKAMMIVPIVGAFLVDIIYQPATVWFIKTFVQNYVG